MRDPALAEDTGSLSNRKSRGRKSAGLSWPWGLMPTSEMPRVSAIWTLRCAC